MDLEFPLFVIYFNPFWIAARIQLLFMVSKPAHAVLYGHLRVLVLYLISKSLRSVRGAASQVFRSLSFEPVA